MEKKSLAKDLIVLWISVTALVCAALNMHVQETCLELRILRQKTKNAISASLALSQQAELPVGSGLCAQTYVALSVIQIPV